MLCALRPQMLRSFERATENPMMLFSGSGTSDLVYDSGNTLRLRLGTSCTCHLSKKFNAWLW